MNRLRSALLGLGLLLAASAAQAQTNVKADIPFDFVVGNQSMPAGEYTVVAQGSGSPAIWIRSEDGKATAVSLTNACVSADPSDKTKLIFHRLAGQYFLSQIWTEGNSSGRELRKSSVEMHLAKNNNQSGEFVLAARITR
jgi:hypothetical protein